MQKSSTLALAAACFGVLASCYPPDYGYPPPPPRMRPNPSFAQEMTAPDSRRDAIAPLDNSIEPVNPTPRPEPAPTMSGGHPTATRTNDPDKVISPYPPYKVIDISNPRIGSGELARDPTNFKIFRVP